MVSCARQREEICIVVDLVRHGGAGALSVTQQELDEVRVVLQEERARYDELALLSDGYQMEAVLARDTHFEVGFQDPVLAV